MTTDNRTPNKDYPLPAKGNMLSTDVVRLGQAIIKVDSDMVTAEQLSAIRHQQNIDSFAAVNEKLRKARLNALLDENVLPL